MEPFEVVWVLCSFVVLPHETNMVSEKEEPEPSGPACVSIIVKTYGFDNGMFEPETISGSDCPRKLRKVDLSS